MDAAHLGDRPDVWGVLVTYDSAATIVACLQGVLEGLPGDRVVVVDNASADDTVARIEATFPEVVVLRGRENRGFGRACNLGMRWAIDRGAELIFQFNDDALVDRKACDVLVHVADANPGYGILVPVNRSEVGGPVDPTFRDELRRRGPDELWSDLLLGDAALVYPVHVLPGAVALVRVAMLRELGGFDPLYFVYGTEYDLCLRTRGSPWRVGLVPGATVVHDYDRPEPDGFRRRIRRSRDDSVSIGLLFAKRPSRPFTVSAVIAILLTVGRLLVSILSERDVPKAVGVALAIPRLVVRLPTVRRHRNRIRNERFAFLDDIQPTDALEEIPDVGHPEHVT